MKKSRLRVAKKLYLFIRRFSIRRRLMIVYLIQVLLVVLWCGYMIGTGVRNAISTVTLGNARIVNTVTENLRGTIACLQTLTKYPVLRPNLRTTFTYDYLSNPADYQPYQFDNEFKSQCRNLFDLYPDVQSISLFHAEGSGRMQRADKPYAYAQETGDFGSVPPNQKTRPWFETTVSSQGVSYIWPEKEIRDCGIATEEGWIFASRSIFNAERFENVGVILAGADVSGGLRLFAQERAFPSERMGVFDDKGKLLLGDFSAEDFTRAHETLFAAENGREMTSLSLQTARGRMLYTYSTLLEGYCCIVETPFRDVLFFSLKEQAGFIAVLGLLLFFIVFSTNLIVGSITRPIRQLERACSRMGVNRWSVCIRDDGNDELSAFTRSFNDMSREIETLISEVYEKDLLSGQLEIQMLREQINPHFLYNTLESIRCAALLKGEAELGEMIFLLAKTLRYGVSQTEGTVTVRQEMDNLEDYMRLQKLRYKNRVHFRVSILPQLLDCRIIRLLLQPLVENALYHGISSQENGGTIDILGFCEEGVITFRVVDDGAGMDIETLHALNDYISGKNENFRSIGVRNVCRRIQLHYGKGFGVTLDSSSGKGTMVTVRVPLRPADDDTGLL